MENKLGFVLATYTVRIQFWLEMEIKLFAYLKAFLIATVLIEKSFSLIQSSNGK